MPRSQLAVAPATAATESAAVPMQERAYRLLRENPRPTEQEIRFGLAGNLCRCTGYQNIVKAVQAAADKLAAAA